MVRTCLKISAITALLLSANVVGMEEPNAAVNEEAKKCPRTPSLPVAELHAEILSNPAGRGGRLLLYCLRTERWYKDFLHMEQL